MKLKWELNLGLEDSVLHPHARKFLTWQLLIEGYLNSLSAVAPVILLDLYDLAK